MEKEYINDYHLQIAMTEYRDLFKDGEAVTPNNDILGTVTQVYNNTTGAGEQVYAVVKNPDEKAEDVQESYAIL
ncbi:MULTISPECIES: hypothetical protein [Streptococcus]|jgi:hypothetical protein|uniref:hypothetical protein n=1 Tax=Streptococcus TaxID=1301 RepID=UPI00146DC43C|nr:MULTISPECIES: hypothetical protein [Streptococcus]NMD83509.1 hypothetical protein [Streptococcus sp. WB01_FAA12]